MPASRSESIGLTSLSVTFRFCEISRACAPSSNETGSDLNSCVTSASPPDKRGHAEDETHNITHSFRLMQPSTINRNPFQTNERTNKCLLFIPAFTCLWVCEFSVLNMCVVLYDIICCCVLRLLYVVSINYKFINISTHPHTHFRLESLQLLSLLRLCAPFLYQIIGRLQSLFCLYKYHVATVKKVIEIVVCACVCVFDFCFLS